MVGRVNRDAHQWGVTPLYLALKKAILALDESGIQESSSKRIIAITDGVNFIDPDLPPGTEKTVDSTDILGAAEKHRDIRIDIVGFDIKADKQENPRSFSAELDG